MLARVGKPTQRPHNDRMVLVRKQKQKEIDRIVHDQLRAWLAQYGDIFRED